MMDATTNANIEHMTLRAVVIRADGTVEDLGVIAFWHKNPLVRWWYRLTKFFRR